MRTLIFLLALLLVPASASAQQFGATLAASETELFAGEGGNRVTPGSVYVYTKAANGSWVESGSLMASDAGVEEDGFGRALSVDGSVLAVGAPALDAVYVFEKGCNGKWSQTARLSGF